MNNGIDISDLDQLERFEEDAPVKGLPSEKQIFDQSLSLIKESMKDVKQEMLIDLGNNDCHIVYINSVEISPKGKIFVDWNTPSTERKAELAAHVEKCIKIQVDELLKEYNSRSMWTKLKSKFK